MNKIRIMIPYFWELFKRYLNNPSYFVREEDILADLFMNGEEDVRQFIFFCNEHALSNGFDLLFKYKPQITYKEILKQLNHAVH